MRVANCVSGSSVFSIRPPSSSSRLAAQDHVWAVSKNWGGLVASPQGPFNSINKLSLSRVQQK